MSNPIGKTERQHLEEERDIILACLAICEAACIKVDQVSELITGEHQKSISRDDKRVASSLSELVGTGRRQPKRQPQTDTPSSTSSKAARDTTSPSQHSNLVHRQRETQPDTKGLSEMGGRTESRGNSAEGSQGELQEDSFVLVESPDEDVSGARLKIQ